MKVVTPLLSDKESKFNDVIISKVRHYFPIEKFGQDISIISNLDVRLVFLY